MQKSKISCLELRRLETIYRTFVKMNPDERVRAINFLSSRYWDDIERELNKKDKKSNLIKINVSLNKKKKPAKKSTNYINAKKYLKNEKTKKTTQS